MQQGSNFGLEVLQSKGQSTDPIISDEDTISTPMNNKASLRKKRSKSNSKSVHMSVKFAVIREINRLIASLMRKFETTRAVSGSSTASKDRWTTLTTPTKVFINYKTQF